MANSLGLQSGPAVSLDYEVENLSVLVRRFDEVDARIKRGMRKEVMDAAKPTAAFARNMALANIENMQRSPRWAEMKIGVERRTITEVYMVPKSHQKGKNRMGRSRSNLHPLLRDRAMEPAADMMRPIFEANMQRMVDEELHRFG